MERMKKQTKGCFGSEATDPTSSSSSIKKYQIRSSTFTFPHTPPYVGCSLFIISYNSLQYTYILPTIIIPNYLCNHLLPAYETRSPQKLEIAHRNPPNINPNRQPSLFVSLLLQNQTPRQALLYFISPFLTKTSALPITITTPLNPFRYGVRLWPPLFSLSFSSLPTASAALIGFPFVSPHRNQRRIGTNPIPNMLDSVLLALFLPCLGMSAVFMVYMCLLWYATTRRPDVPMPVKPVAEKGLSASDLERLPKITGKELVMGSECAVCLDEIESEQQARLVPGCNHGFHVECADAWLSKHPLCPVCRAKLLPQLDSSQNNPC